MSNKPNVDKSLALASVFADNCALNEASRQTAGLAALVLYACAEDRELPMEDEKVLANLKLARKLLAATEDNPKIPQGEVIH